MRAKILTMTLKMNREYVDLNAGKVSPEETDETEETD